MKPVVGLSIGSVVCVFGCFAAGAVTKNPEVFKWSEEHKGTPLNIEGMELTFSDEFDKQTVTDEKGKGLWIAPGHAPYGEASFDAPDIENSTYTISNGTLKIRATKSSNGKWRAGSVQTVNSAGVGFGQSMGYFETRIRFPKMLGAWCAFWLKTQHESTDASLIKAELDVIEWYGGDPRGHHQSVHLRPNRETAGLGGITKHWHLSNYTGFPDLGGDWHTHGVLIDQDFITVYMDGKEVARFPALDEFKAPLYPLVSMTLYKEDVAKAVSPFDMEVDYVRIYKWPIKPMPPEMSEPR